MVEVLVQVWPNTISYFNQASECIKGENLPGFTHASSRKSQCVMKTKEKQRESTG